MLKPSLTALAVAAAVAAPLGAQANDNAELESLRAEIQQMKQSYESRIQSLESKLQETVAVASRAEDSAQRAETTAVQAGSRPTASNAFNPDISLILTGTYTNRSQDSNFHISDFQAAGEIGPGSRGWSLGESELGVYASVDDRFYGGLNLALAPDNSVGVEEAFIQTTALPAGLTIKGGRFFSGIGYLNEQHAHTWDFVDNPLAYQAFLGNQFGDDGVQLKWLAPADLFVELGAEFGRGRIANTSGKDKNGGSANSVFAHAGGDWGTSSSWRAGLSYLRVSPENRQSADLDTLGAYVTNSFSGTQKLWIADAVWKWAPNGNATNTSFKLQGEYLYRQESGTLIYDTAAANTGGDYSASQSGWYVQGVYKFMPQWRTGLRFDQLDSGSANYGTNAVALLNTGDDPRRISWMLDYNPSEFSRIRLQFARDESRAEATDNQLFIQYQMSLGAHGAHKY